jgi:hypothetical protein
LNGAGVLRLPGRLIGGEDAADAAHDSFKSPGATVQPSAFLIGGELG